MFVNLHHQSIVICWPVATRMAIRRSEMRRLLAGNRNTCLWTLNCGCICSQALLNRRIQCRFTVTSMEHDRLRVVDLLAWCMYTVMATQN